MAIHLTYSNRTEALLAALARRLERRRREGADPLAPIVIVAPNRNVERFVELGLARTLGIAANLRFTRLATLAREWLGPSGTLLIDAPLLARIVRSIVDESLLEREPMRPVQRYLRGAGDHRDAIDRRRAELALHLARLFEEYQFSRPEMLRAWDANRTVFRGPPARTEAWQSELWRAMRAIGDPLPLSDALDRLRESKAEMPELYVFGVSYVARAFSELFAALGELGDLHLYALNPCEEFWEDLETEHELLRRRRASEAEPIWAWEEDPFRLSVDTETPLLRLWGRPGREHVRLLGALTGCDFAPAFVDPIEREPDVEALPLFATLRTPSLLARLQHDVLVRAPRRTSPPADARRDDSVVVLACPSIRREVETVAAMIWHLVTTLGDLTFDRIAILVNGPDRDLYLPHLTAALEEAHRIPYNLADLSLVAASPLVECALRLLELPATRLTRPDVLAVITHPAVRAGTPAIHAQEWGLLCDRLGIFFGLDQREHEGTYVTGDRLNFDQGLTRIALGAFMSAEGGDGEPRFVELGADRYLPEADAEGSAAHFAQLVRSLLSDVRFAREASLSITAWGTFFSALFRAYLTPEDDREEGSLRRLCSAMADLRQLDVDGTAIGFTLASALARDAIEGMTAGRGQQLADGVAISSLLPMRAIPFRVIFVLGLGEGRFPAADRRDSMDLRAAKRHVGDVTPPERDRYTFLETVLSARERLVLSYVARDERTGEPLAPASVIDELLEVIEEGYLPNARQLLVRQRIALRRHEEPEIVAISREAAAEARARRLGVALRVEAPALLARSSSAELARRAAQRAPVLHDVLALPPLPERNVVADTQDVLRLSLGSLRRFLEDPMQAWTRVVLRLDEDEIDRAPTVADEPFAPAALDAAIALRAAFVDHVVHGIDAEAAYRSRVEPIRARGRWPLGALAELWSQAHAETLDRWQRQLDAVLAPGASRFRARFGSALEPTPAERTFDPIAIEFADDPRRRGNGRALRVELVGRTELLADEPSCSILPLLRRASGARGRVDDLRYALRAFIDQAALAASGREGAHRAVLLVGDTEGDAAIVELAPIAPDAARAWFATLVRELLVRPHAYLMPCEAVLRLVDEWPRARGDELVRSIEEVRDRWAGGQSRFGPVRDPGRYPPLPAGEAEAAAEARFGPFVRAVRGGLR